MAYDPVRDEIVVPQIFAFSVLTFRADSNGNVAPIRKIFGPKTQLKDPDALGLDATHGEIFVPLSDKRILVFPRDGDGDVAPIRILQTDSNPNRVAIDPVHNLLIVSGGPRLKIYDRTASGNDQPRAVITIPKNLTAKDTNTALMQVYPPSGMIFVGVQASGRYDSDDYVGVWNINDHGEVPPRWTIGGPNFILKDVRGIALDPKSKNVIISDKTLNSAMTFHVPEVF